MLLSLTIVIQSLVIIATTTATDNSVAEHHGENDIFIKRPMAAQDPIFLNESRVIELLEGQWIALIEAMRRALLATASKTAVQQPRSFTPVKGKGVLLSMPGYVEIENDDYEKEAVLACKLVTGFQGNPKKEEPLPAILGTILLFDTSTGKLTSIIEATEITARRTAAASVAATDILYNKRHSKTYGDSIILCILGAGVQGKSHAQAFHAAYQNISEIRIWNHRSPKAESLVAELKTLGVSQASVSATVQECAEGADILVTATSANEPFLRSEWVKYGAHINAIGSGQTHYSEIELALYQKARVYLDDQESGGKELQGLTHLGIPLIAPVGEIILKPEIMPGEQEVTIFHSCGMAAEDALAAQLVYKQHLLAQQTAELNKN